MKFKCSAWPMIQWPMFQIGTNKNSVNCPVQRTASNGEYNNWIQIKIIIQAMLRMSQHKYAWLTKHTDCYSSFSLCLSSFACMDCLSVGRMAIFIYGVFSQWFYLFIYLRYFSDIVSSNTTMLIRNTLEWIAQTKPEAAVASSLSTSQHIR